MRSGEHMSDTKKRIARGERVTWRAGNGYPHGGTVLVFVPAGESIIGHLPESARHGDCKWKPRQDASPRDRYLLQCQLPRRAATYHCPIAATVERQNPQAKREP
jgi:hypothetical protein